MNICVYGASSADIDKSFTDAAERLGALIAQRGHGLVFGGGASGMMGGTARGAYREGGKIIGVVPNFFNVDGILFDKCSEMIRTETMRERKQIMEDRSDAFIMTPGGIGTFEEFFEILTLKQLGRHEKAIVVFDINGYYNSMNSMLDEAVKRGFMTSKCKNLFYTAKNEIDAVDYIENYKAEKFNILELKEIKDK